MAEPRPSRAAFPGLLYTFLVSLSSSFSGPRLAGWRSFTKAVRNEHFTVARVHLANENAEKRLLTRQKDELGVESQAHDCKEGRGKVPFGKQGLSSDTHSP